MRQKETSHVAQEGLKILQQLQHGVQGYKGLVLFVSALCLDHSAAVLHGGCAQDREAGRVRVDADKVVGRC